MQNGKVIKFTDLEARQNGHVLVLSIYRETDRWAQKHKSLSNKMQHAAVSVASNIAVGFGRQGVADKKLILLLHVGQLRSFKTSY